MRHHSNICLSDFEKSIKFVMNEDCYTVFCYGWNMIIKYFKMENDQVILVKEINLNDYVKGAINKNDEFVPADYMRNKFGVWTASEKGIDEYKKVVYHPIPNIILQNPITDSDIVYISFSEDDREYKFVLNSGYRWEDTDQLIHYTDDNGHFSIKY